MNHHNHRDIFRYDNGNYCLQLAWEELSYDIRAVLHRHNNPAIAAGEMSAVNVISEEDNDHLARIFQDTLSDLHGSLTAYIRQDSRMASDEIDDTPEYYNIRLHFDEGWRGSAKALCDAAHAYLVSRALSELLALANDGLASRYGARAQQALNRIRREANAYNLNEPIIFRL